MDKETKMSLYKEALVRKLEKVKNRLKIIDRYVADEKSKQLTLGQWLKVKGLDIREFFASIGYNSEYDRALSHDSENKFINSAKDVIFDKSKGHPVIKTEEKSGIDGMIFNEHTQRYYPVNDTICSSLCFSLLCRSLFCIFMLSVSIDNLEYRLSFSFKFCQKYQYRTLSRID
jgi:hypothetical protein